jgi:hypothetical protein
MSFFPRGRAGCVLQKGIAGLALKFGLLYRPASEVHTPSMLWLTNGPLSGTSLRQSACDVGFRVSDLACIRTANTEHVTAQ